MGDYLIRATAANLLVRAVAADTRDLTEYARRCHNTSPVMTAALGRLLTGTVMMGAGMKDEKNLLTVRIDGDGPAKGLIATANNRGEVKGYAFVPDVCIPANSMHKLDVAGAVGKGSLTVIKDLGLKEPYIGKTELVSGEIAEDFTYYYALSEQTPSSVGLGVLMNNDNTVRRAGGFIIQLMPGADEEVVSALESRIKDVSGVTSLLEQGMTPEDILNMLLSGMNPEITDRIPCSYKCGCSRQRVTRALISIGKKGLCELISEDKPISVSCDFCEKAYEFDVSDLKAMLAEAYSAKEGGN